MSPTVNDLKSSNFLTKEDVDPPVKATITKYEEMNVALESQAPEMKWVLHFKELDKPMVLNITNGQRIQVITGSDDFKDWIGQTITLYNDKTVAFAGKITGGIRVYVPQPEVEAATPSPAMKPVGQQMDDLINDPIDGMPPDTSPTDPPF